MTEKKMTWMMNFPWAVSLIIGINLLVWIYLQWFSLNWFDFFSHYAFIPKIFTVNIEAVQFSLGPFLTLVSSLFLHGSWLHILINMAYLLIFGPEIERKMGLPRFLSFYLLCGIGGILGQYIFTIQGSFAMIGASGSISGVLACYLLVHPFMDLFKPNSVLSKIAFFPVATVFYIFFWFIFQIGNGVYYFLLEGVMTAWISHAAGFLTGMLCFSFFLTKRKDEKIHYI